LAQRPQPAHEAKQWHPDCLPAASRRQILEPIPISSIRAELRNFTPGVSGVSGCFEIGLRFVTAAPPNMASAALQQLRNSYGCSHAVASPVLGLPSGIAVTAQVILCWLHRVAVRQGEI